MATWTVQEYQRGLLYERGKFIRLLEPGRYSYWWFARKHIRLVDMRETSQSIQAQEILTSDKIGIRVTLIAQFRISDPIKATHDVENHVSQLYQDLQLTLRESVTSKDLESLLKDRDPMAAEIHAEVAPRAAEYGIELKRVGVKDVVLPGAVRAVFLQEMEAELKGRASLVAARHEVAAARARANTAKMLTENPHLLRLRELEVLSEIASKSGNVVVIPGLDRIIAGAAADTSDNDKPK